MRQTRKRTIATVAKRVSNAIMSALHLLSGEEPPSQPSRPARRLIGRRGAARARRMAAADERTIANWGRGTAVMNDVADIVRDADIPSTAAGAREAAAVATQRMANVRAMVEGRMSPDQERQHIRAVMAKVLAPAVARGEFQEREAPAQGIGVVR